MTRFISSMLGVLVLAAGLLACGGGSEPPSATATLPPVGDAAVQQPIQPAVQSQSAAPQPQAGQTESPLDMAAQPPEQLRGEEAPPAPWPTFTPGPEPQSGHRLLFARTRRFYTANADGSDIQRLELSQQPPQLFGGSFKDPGRGWLGPNSRYLVYFADQEAQLWRADLSTSENVLLAERMIPAGQEDEGEFIRILTQQTMSWTSDGGRVALLGVPDTVDLFILDAGANSLTRVTQDELHESQPQWSSNGRYLAYVVTDQSAGTRALYVLDTSSQQIAQIDMGVIRDSLGLAATTRFVFGDDMQWVSETQLAFYPRTDNEGRSAGIWLYDAAQGTVQPATTDQIQYSDWSGMARAWAYTTATEPQGLWLLQLGAAQPQLLVEGPAAAPVWKPDGRSVLYSWSNPDTTGWDLRVADVGGGERTLAQNVSLIQPDLSDPGPAGKRYWDPNGQMVLYTAVGRDYGRANQAEGGYGVEAGPDLENWWMVPAGAGEPRRVTDMQKVFYLQDPELSPDGSAWAFIAFSYVDRVQHLYAMPREGGHPERVDAGVRWFEWLP